MASQTPHSPAATTTSKPLSAPTSHSTQPESAIKFYNYHEYVLANHADQLAQLGYTVGSSQSPTPVLLTHFDNPYITSTEDNSTTTAARERSRIVRIPREFEQYGDLVPQFSRFFPGTEPGALHGDGNEGEEGDGLTSTSPLRIYISAEDLAPVVAMINLYLKQALSPYSWRNGLDFVANMCSCWMLEQVVPGWEPYSKRRLKELELYVRSINEEWASQGRKVKIVSPLRTGYLSLDLEIPVPPRIGEY